MTDITLLISLSAIAVLLLLSAFFSSTETALTACSRALMHQMEKTGNKKARLVNQLHEQKHRLIGSILIGNNLVNVLASALATSLLIHTFGEAGIAYATIIMTILIVTFSEIIPKTYAIQNSDRLALWVAPIIKPIVFLFSPLTRAAAYLTFGFSQQTQLDNNNNSEELRGAIDLHEGDHETVLRERAMLSSVLDLAEVEVEEIMVHRNTVSMINADDETENIVSQVLTSPYTRLPLWRENTDNIVGVIHAKELLRTLNNRQNEEKLPEIGDLSTPPWFIPGTTRLLDQLQAFRDRREHFALVVDEYGSLMGVVTLEDILEEIVGDISDEFDTNIPNLRQQSDGSYIINGNFTIRDLNRQLDWQLPDDEASTIAGLILHESRRIPDVGQTFLFYGIRFDILRRKRNQITSIRIKTIKPLDDSEEI